MDDGLDTGNLDPIITVSLSEQEGSKTDWDYKIDTALNQDDLARLLTHLADEIRRGSFHLKEDTPAALSGPHQIKQ
mgnify:FL=1|tara:strand:- start:201 stop:428 length:228 start_codon:yes stop_codon:yes gene_type:complete